MRVADEYGPARSQREQIASWIGVFLLYEPPVKGRLQAVDDHEPTSIVRITCHEGFCQIVQTRPVDHNSRPTYRVDEWSSRGVTQHVHVASLCRVHEGLTHIAMNHELTVLENLSSLILSSTMDRYLTAVNARSDIITYIAVTVDLQSIRSRTQPASDEPMASQVVQQDVLPALVVCVDHEPGRALVSLDWKFQSINHQDLRVQSRMRKSQPVLPVQPSVEVIV